MLIDEVSHAIDHVDPLWLKDDPELLVALRTEFKNNPEGQGIDPGSTPVFYRSKAEVDAIRGKPCESGGHHPHDLASQLIGIRKPWISQFQS